LYILNIKQIKNNLYIQMKYLLLQNALLSKHACDTVPSNDAGGGSSPGFRTERLLDKTFFKRLFWICLLVS